MHFGVLPSFENYHDGHSDGEVVEGEFERLAEAA